ncbi:hypothetical protein [Poseidonocella sedimentorum]|uniref:Uncharacterized protein n=1 Tax=Poseidonocella sedimentorum TaxID=871652 RepID=A0A1I6CVR2_9RHOB|nr:hypothetical protein [Poseidonocella sedimentorum]SFQ97240.1 hypothetical protein SAMN04515673_101452 [Poseidonocella sedimentorum]
MIRFLLSATVGLLAYRAWTSSRPASVQHVRDAGPSQMRNPPRRWDMVDEQIDESFPASDPPANY